MQNGKSMVFFIRKIIETKNIKMESDDGNIKAKVIGGHLFITGDIRPILLYKINGAEKRYTYRFYYNAGNYPVGQEVDLKLSKISGLAYDKSDIIKDLIFITIRILFWSFVVLVGLYYICFVC